MAVTIITASHVFMYRKYVAISVWSRWFGCNLKLLAWCFCFSHRLCACEFGVCAHLHAEVIVPEVHTFNRGQQKTWENPYSFPSGLCIQIYILLPGDQDKKAERSQVWVLFIFSLIIGALGSQLECKNSCVMI